MKPSGLQTITKHEILNGVINDGDNRIGDTNNDANSDLWYDQLNGNELNFNESRTSRTVINGGATALVTITITPATPATGRSDQFENMTIPQKSDSVGVRRPSSISLKHIVTTVDPANHQPTSEDALDGCFSSESDPLKSEVIDEFRSKGINVRFDKLIYRKRYGMCWNRGECWKLMGFFFLFVLKKEFNVVPCS